MTGSPGTSSGTPRGTIELRGVSRTYGPTLALSGFSHVFEPGRVHALMGKNGSGKSTLVKILAGAVQPTEGELHVNGERVSVSGPGEAVPARIPAMRSQPAS